jgi:hypothetical protein
MRLSKEEFFEKYGNIKLEFDSPYYYKDTLLFRGAFSDGGILYCAVNKYDVYNNSKDLNRKKTVTSIKPFRGDLYKNGELIEYFEDF